MVSVEVVRDSQGPARLRLAFDMRLRMSGFDLARVGAYLLVGAVLLALPAANDGIARAASRGEPIVYGVTAERRVVQATRPLVTTVRPEPPTVLQHVVRDGESLFTIADRYGVTPQTVGFNNDLSDSGSLRAGDVLVVPTVEAALHTVRPDDTPEGVARTYATQPALVVEANRLLNEPDNFLPGKTILVPVRDGLFPGYRLQVSDPPRAAPFARDLTRGRLLWPVAGAVTQRFYSWHTGIDIAAAYGSPVASAEAGTVAAVGFVSGGGLRVCVRHDWGLQTCYYHLGSTAVLEGERVVRGQRIGSIGLTGTTTGPHVHWEASVEGAFLDPLTY